MQADIALKEGKGLGNIVIKLVKKAEESGLPFDYEDVAREIQEFQRDRIKRVFENGEDISRRQEVEDIHTYFCVAPF